MLRTIFFAIFLVPWALFTSVICLLFGRSFHDRFGNLGMYLFGWGSLKLAGVRLEVDLSALDPAQTYVFMPNHQSNFDIPILSVALKQWTMRMVAKEKLFKIPVWGWAIGKIGHVPIDRSNPRAAMRAIDQAVALGKEGVSVLVFPEGTRNPVPDPEQLQPFQVGGFVLALKTGLPVAPIVVEGSGRIMPKGSRNIAGGLVRIKALAPIPAGTHTIKERERFKDELWPVMNRAYQELHHGR